MYLYIYIYPIYTYAPNIPRSHAAFGAKVLGAQSRSLAARRIDLHSSVAYNGA